MQKHVYLRIAALIAVICCLFCFAACDDEPNEGGKTESGTNAPTTTEPGTDQPTDPPRDQTGVIKKITGAADETGIYAIVITLSDKAADKGAVEMIYYGPKGSPEENSIVNTFRIEYEKNSDETFEIHTFYDGEVYQNFHGKSEVKVTHQFGATVRARCVIVSYAPDGEELSEIYRANAEDF